MTFEEWWEQFNSCCPLDIADEDIAKWTWEVAFDEGVKWTLQQDANTQNKLGLCSTRDTHTQLSSESVAQGHRKDWNEVD